MESILARALEYTLKYWLKSFSRDQFKLQGRTVQLSNLDINGDALHASMGLPPALHVTTAKVGKLEIMLPYISNVQVEPIVVQIDRFDLVLEENHDVDLSKSPSSVQTSTTAGKGSGYGFADKIADGMTVQVRTVNLLLETRGAAHSGGDATWAPPMASVTVRNLVLYTTNENWQVVNLKEARDFSSNKMSIYVFKKLEWESLSVDLLPHPDMFTDANLARSQEVHQRDDDGAKRVFFGGERFIEGIAGEAYITIQRTELNSPLGLEVQLHVTEAVCPALSEPGLRALLRFLTGIYVCLNRGDVDINSHQGSAEAAGRSLVSFVVDHIFLCIKDAEFRLELLMQSLFFSRASIADGEKTSNLTKVMIGGLFLRDTFSHPPCTLVQPSMSSVTDTSTNVPEFARDFLPPICPLSEQPWQSPVGVPLICLHSLQVQPSPAPPAFALQTVICCQPLLVKLQEESCLRISSFLADGVVINAGAVVPDSSINCLSLELKELDITVPLDTKRLDCPSSNGGLPLQNTFSGARLHMGKLYFQESPSLKLKLLNLDKDPACFSLWAGQPIDASQKKWKAGALHVSLSLETSAGLGGQYSVGQNSGSWMCVELSEAKVEMAMISGDGNSLTIIPPPGGVVRMGIACQQFLSNTSVEQLFFVLDLYAYFGSVTEKITAVGRSKRLIKVMNVNSSRSFTEKAPCDTAVSLVVTDLQLRFLESSSTNIQELPLVQFMGNDLFIKVSHRTLGGAIAVSSTVSWKSVEVDCVDAEEIFEHEYAVTSTSAENGTLVNLNGYHSLRPVFWVHNHKMQPSYRQTAGAPFLDISMAHVIPFNERDRECHSLSVSACISGVRLGGGMNYTEALLHRFGILGPDGGPGERLSKGLENLSAGPLSKLLRPSILLEDDLGCGGSLGEKKDGGIFQLGLPDDVDVSIDLRDWLFALEGAPNLAERWWFDHQGQSQEYMCWHTVFQSLRVKARSSPFNMSNSGRKLHAMHKYPVESVTVGIEGLEVLKPRAQKGSLCFVSPENGSKESFQTSGGVNFEVRLVTSAENSEDEMINWMAENLKFSVNQPIEAIVTKDELKHLTSLCKSEIDSMGRIVAGLLRLLKLENSVGKETIYKLSNLGTEGFDKIFSSDKPSTGHETGSNGLPSYMNLPTSETRTAKLESTVASLEKVLIDSKAKCYALITDIDRSESSEERVNSIKELNHKLESMQNLVAQLRGQI